MRRIAVMAAAAVLAGMSAAYAQDTTTAPPPAPAIEVPPSTCPEVPAAPAAPDGATVTATQLREASYEAWRATAIAPMQCRLQEARVLQAQARARVAEYEAADAANQAAGAAWQAQVAIAEARRRR